MKILYKGYEIERKWRSHGKPQPDEWVFAAEDYDGPEDYRVGYGESYQDCVDQIEWLENGNDHPRLEDIEVLEEDR